MESSPAVGVPVAGPLAGRLVASSPEVESGLVVFLHGFTQTGLSWWPIARRLREETGRAVALLDLPGHGGSSEVRADLPRTADLLAETVRTLTSAPAAWVGYSLGGRCALHVAERHPRLVERLALVGATAGIDDADERAERRAADERLAVDLETMGVDAFLDRWLTVPLFRGFVPDEFEQRLRRTNTVEGLAASLRECGTGTQRPLWDDLRSFTAPALVMAGERDQKFVTLADRLVRILPAASAHLIPGAAHMAHLENPGAVMAILREFLATEQLSR